MRLQVAEALQGPHPRLPFDRDVPELGAAETEEEEPAHALKAGGIGGSLALPGAVTPPTPEGLGPPGRVEGVLVGPATEGVHAAVPAELGGHGPRARDGGGGQGDGGEKRQGQAASTAAAVLR